MIKSLEALDALAGISATLLSSPVAGVELRSKSQLKGLDKVARWIEARVDGSAPPKPPLNAAQVWARWEADKFFDGIAQRDKECRTLCVSVETAMRQEWVRLLERHPGPLMKRTNLLGFVHAYFFDWREMTDPERVEFLLRSHLITTPGTEGSRVLSCWRDNLFLFSAAAAERLAEEIRVQRSLETTRLAFFLEKDVRLLSAAKKIAADAEVKYLAASGPSMSEQKVLERLAFLRTELLDRQAEEGQFRDRIANLLLSSLPERESIRRELVQWVHEDIRLGDPRLAACAPNWRLVPQEARDKFLGWLAVESIHFFFNTLVPQNDENRRRADFWLRCAEYTDIRDFQVVVSPDDEWRIRVTRSKTVPHYAKFHLTEGKSSAFLMMFKTADDHAWIVAEFSETGNAAHICTKQKFETNGVTLRNSSFRWRDVHNPSRADERILHVGDWEPKARRRLAEIGIRAS